MGFWDKINPVTAFSKGLQGTARFFGAGEDLGRHPVNARERARLGGIKSPRFGPNAYTSEIGGLESDVRQSHRGSGGAIYGEGVQGYGGFRGENPLNFTPDYVSGLGAMGKAYNMAQERAYEEWSGRTELISGNISHLAGVFSELQDTDLAFNTVGGTSGILTHQESALEGGGVSRSYTYDIKEDIAGDRRSLRAAMGKEMTKRSAYLESFFRN